MQAFIYYDVGMMAQNIQFEWRIISVNQHVKLYAF